MSDTEKLKRFDDFSKTLLNMDEMIYRFKCGANMVSAICAALER